MGLRVSTWGFSEGLPETEAIRAEFLKVSGLYLSVVATLDIKEFTLDRTLIAERLHADVENYLREEKEGLRKQHWQAYRNPYNGILGIYLSCPGFYNLDIRIPSDGVLEIEYGLRQHYFPLCLERVFHQLGGQLLSVQGEPRDPSKEVLQQWEQLRPWNTYKWYNRPRK